MGFGKGTVEIVVSSADFWAGRRVLLTGHTGFKGGWLALWLHALGARVHGYALNPPTEPNLFEAAGIAALLAADVRADLADLPRLRATISEARPDIVLHLAAQPLVRESYRDPLGTLATNVMGTAHLLDAVRDVGTVRAVVVVTTDKVYENREWVHPYRECDPLGGHDPYSASKAAAEIVTASYRSSFFAPGAPHATRIATARAGNVIGGGDWAADRLVPDCLRAFGRGESVLLRKPQSVRPWQHVLEPLAGYLRLAQCLAGEDGDAFSQAWNFGPDASGDATVGKVAQAVAQHWGDGAHVVCAPGALDPHEAGLLRLDSTRARTLLGWQPRWSLDDALARTVEWHRAWMRGEDMRLLCAAQIRDYEGRSES